MGLSLLFEKHNFKVHILLIKATLIIILLKNKLVMIVTERTDNCSITFSCLGQKNKTELISFVVALDMLFQNMSFKVPNIMKAI